MLPTEYKMLSNIIFPKLTMFKCGQYDITENRTNYLRNTIYDSNKDSKYFFLILRYFIHFAFDCL